MNNLYRTVPGIKHPVVVSKMSEYDVLPLETRKAELKSIVMCGGFFAINLTGEQIAAMNLLPGVTEELMVGIKPGYAICVLEDIADLMSDNEVIAILHHEDAHIIHGDVNAKHCDITLLEGTGFAIMPEWEFAADTHAAAMVGAIAMHDGLIAAITATGILMNSLRAGDFGNTYIEEAMKDPTIMLRLKALEAMM